MALFAVSVRRFFKTTYYGHKRFGAMLRAVYFIGEKFMVTVEIIDNQDKINEAIELAHNTFLQFVAPDYSQVGCDSFRCFIYGGDIERKIKDGSMFVCGAYNEDKSLVGMCAVRDAKHISLLFVKKGFLRQGIGRMLLDFAVEKCKVPEITVNSSPYGVQFYINFGFVQTECQKNDDGIIYTPMKLMVDTIKK